MAKMTFSVYFGAAKPSSDPKCSHIAAGLTEEEALQVAAKDKAERFPEHHYYCRYWTDTDGITTMDFGSWSEFYFIIPDHSAKAL